jgi:NDP-sugar pyrophosphorylase family protein
MSYLSETTVAILVGGLGTRLKSIVSNRPKALAEINGKFFLSYLFDYLIKAGFKFVVLCTGHLGDQIKNAYGDAYDSLQLIYSQESVPLGTAGGLRLAEPLFISDPIFVMNGDSIYDIDINRFWIWYGKKKRNASLLLTKVSDIRRFGQVIVDKHERVIRFDEKSNKLDSGWINSGIYIIERKLIKEIPLNTKVSLENEIFPSWIKKQFYGFKTEGRFIDIGTPESYNNAKYFFLLNK